MARLLRTIVLGNWENWDFPWLADGDLPADPFGDFQTRRNALSVWEVNEDESLLGRVAAAHTVKRQCANEHSVRALDYILFDSKILSDMEIGQTQITGDTFDPELDSDNHFHLVELSARKLHKLIDRIRACCRPERKQPKEVLKYIQTSFKNGHMRETDLSVKALKKLNDQLSKLK